MKVPTRTRIPMASAVRHGSGSSWARSILVLLWIALLSHDVQGFLSLANPTSVSLRSASGTILHSTLDKPSTRSGTASPGPTAQKGAISMSLDELSNVMGGRGRARLAWDCYSIGVDPALFYNPVIQLGQDDFETVYYNLLPTSRRGQTLGQQALQNLADTYDSLSSKIDLPQRLEGGVATLSHISKSSDSTTKLLLRMADGLEVETVIIPWNGSRSTLCISSQVGCRQGTYCPFDHKKTMPMMLGLTLHLGIQVVDFVQLAVWANSVP